MNDNEQVLNYRRKSLVRILRHLQQRGGSAGPDDWVAVEARLASHPHEASRRDRFGQYPLHLVFRIHCLPPLSLVHALLLAKKDAASSTLSFGQTPMHLLLEHRQNSSFSYRNFYLHHAFDLVELILQHCPHASKQPDSEGRVPLHLAYSTNIVHALLEANPEAVGKLDVHDQLPLHCIFHSFLDRHKTREAMRALIEKGIEQGVARSGGIFLKDSHGISPFSKELEYFESLIPRWHYCFATGRPAPLQGYSRCPRIKRLEIMARAACSTCPLQSGNRNIPRLHAFIQLNCRWEICWWSLGMKPTDARKRDSQGRFPLHVAAANGQAHWQVIAMLMDSEYAYPQAAGISDADGRLPLHLAAESGRAYKEGISLIANAEPRAFGTRDVKTHMYPFMLSAVSGGCVEAVFRLLREVPWVLSQLII